VQSSHAPTGTTSGPKGQPANPAQLHLFLGIGLVVTAGALGVTRYLTSGLAPEPVTLMTYILSGVSAAMAVTALMVLKRQVPERRPGQPAAQYWADQKNAGPAMLFWFILEGSGIVASVAYFLEGSPIAVALVAFAIGAFWLNGPRAFDQE
jgi:hypothetical protein